MRLSTQIAEHYRQLKAAKDYADAQPQRVEDWKKTISEAYDLMSSFMDDEIQARQLEVLRSDVDGHDPDLGHYQETLMYFSIVDQVFVTFQPGRKTSMLPERIEMRGSKTSHVARLLKVDGKEGWYINAAENAAYLSRVETNKLTREAFRAALTPFFKLI